MDILYGYSDGHLGIQTGWRRQLYDTSIGDDSSCRFTYRSLLASLPVFHSEFTETCSNGSTSKEANGRQ